MLKDRAFEYHLLDLPQVAADSKGSYKTTNLQCSTCKGMCLAHVAGSLLDPDGAVQPARLELLCASCRVYGEFPSLQTAGYDGLRLSFLANELRDDPTGICEAHKEACLQSLCTDCISEARSPSGVLLARGVVEYTPSEVCVASAPMCDLYMFNFTHQICAPKFVTCPPAALGSGSCDAGCDTAACGYDNGDCCTEHAPACNTGMVGNGACDDACNNIYCQRDLSDCDFCTLNVNTTTPFGECYPQWIGDGRCTKQCYTAECGFDDSDCGDCPAACIATLDDGVCNQECYDLCPSEADDCPQCSNNCATDFMLGDGTCNKVRHTHTRARARTPPPPPSLTPHPPYLAPSHPPISPPPDSKITIIKLNAALAGLLQRGMRLGHGRLGR